MKKFFRFSITVIMMCIILEIFTGVTVNAATDSDKEGSSFLSAVNVTSGNSYTVTPVTGNGKYYSFTPTVTGTYIFQSSLYSSGNPQIRVYDSLQNSLGYNDNSGSGNNYYLTLTLYANNTYYIYSYGAAASGYQMTITYREWTLSDSSITIEGGTSYAYLYVYDTTVDSVSSSNNGIVNAYINYNDDDESEIVLTKVGPGTAVITITSYDGTAKTCNVTCEYSPFTLSTSNVIFDKKYPYDSWYVYSTSEESTISSAVSANSKIATASIAYGEVKITPQKAGKTSVTVTDNWGRTVVVNVSINKNWSKENLKYNTYVSIAYGSKKLLVSSKPGAKVTVKIGNQKYTAKIGKKGYKYIRVKSIYKLNTKLKATVKYKNIKTSKTGKVYSATSAYMQTIWSCQYTIPVRAYNVTKGDTIYITVGGKTYKKKVKANSKSTEFVFTTKYQNRNYYSIRIRIKNKYKQTLYDSTRKITWR